MLSKKNLQKYLQIQAKLSDEGNVVIMSQSGVGGVLMPVLCEAISVVVRRDAIDQYYEGGWAKFLEVVPNTTMCTDGDLVRVGFMSPQHVQEFVDVLESSGLQFLGQKNLWGYWAVRDNKMTSSLWTKTKAQQCRVTGLNLKKSEWETTILKFLLLGC